MRQVALSSYNNATARRNVFNQTDLTYTFSTGAVAAHVAGRSRGRPSTHGQLPQHRILQQHRDVDPRADFASPLTNVPVTFRQSATDADNHLRTNLAATYAQDQIELSRHVQLVAGLRFDRFDLQYHNNRNGDTLDPSRQPRVATRGPHRQADRAAFPVYQLQRVIPAKLRRSVLIADER